MKNKQTAIETVAQKPTFVLSYDRFGSETWSTKVRLTHHPVLKDHRTVWPNVQGDFSSDDLIQQILKMNPGTELQLWQSNGIMPYFALYLNNYQVLNLKLPSGVYCTDGYIWANWEQHSMKICLLEILW